MAAALLQTPSSEAFQDAYSCIVPLGYPSITTATLNQGDILLTLVQQGSIDDLLFGGAPSPWNSTFHQDNIKLEFAPGDWASGPGSANINWADVTASTSGFQVAAPAPLPSSEPSANESVWYSQPAKQPSDISFTLIPAGLLRMALMTQGGGSRPYAPLGIEQFLMSAALIVLLRWRRGRKFDIADRAWATTLRLCYLVAALSLTQFAVNLSVSQYISSIFGDIGQIIISVFGLVLIWRLSRWPGRSLAIILFASSVIGAASTVISLGSPRIGDLSLLFFCWAIIIDSIHALFRPTVKHPRRLALYAALLGFLSLVSQAVPFQALYPAYAMSSISGCIVVFGTIVIIARTRRPVPLLLENSDRLLFAVAVGYAMLFTGPQWYLGIHVSVVSLFAIAVTFLVLSVSQHHSLAGLAADALHGKTPAQLQAAQGKLISSEKRLDELTKDLKALEGPPLTKEQFKRRDRLEKEADTLRQWPTAESRSRTGTAARINTGVRRLLGLQVQDEQPGVRFSEPAGPADMALALGPGCEPMQNVRKAFWPAIELVLVPVLYFAWRESFVGTQVSFTLAYPYFNFLTNLWLELTFWLFPLLGLAVAWSSLGGRRGPGRAIQIWLCVALPLIIHSFINDAFNQSATLTPILRCALLLVALLSLGLSLDLSTLRLYRADVTSFRLFQGYVRLNRLVAVLTLLVPLVTAGLTIWSQIDNGALHQKVSPTQVSGQAPSPSPSPSASHSPGK